MLADESLPRKAALVVALPCLVTLVVIGASFLDARSLGEAVTRRVAADDLKDAVEVLLETVRQVDLDLRRAPDNGIETFDFSAAMQRLDDALDRLAALQDRSPEQGSAVMLLVQDTGRLTAAWREAFGLLDAGGEDRTAPARYQQILRASTSILGELQRRGLTVIGRANEAIRQRVRELAAISNRQTFVLGGAAVLATAVMVFVGLLMMRSIVHRLDVVRQNVERTGAGEELLPQLGGNDEIARVDAAVHRMVSTMRSQQRDNDMFVYSVSHDLRSPLVNIQGFSRELARATGDLRELLAGEGLAPDVRKQVAALIDETIAESLTFIEVAVRRQSSIIDSLLRLSRAGRVDYELEPVDARELALGVARSYSHRLSEAGARVTVGLLPTIVADRTAIERVFANLVENAIEHGTSAEGGHIEIGCRTAAAGEPPMVELYVRDEGAGIAAKDRERVFAPFARAGGGRGEGIGLALVRRTIERHGGRVWIESELGAGTTVVLTLPADAGQRFVPRLVPTPRSNAS